MAVVHIKGDCDLKYPWLVGTTWRLDGAGCLPVARLSAVETTFHADISHIPQWTEEWNPGASVRGLQFGWAGVVLNVLRRN